MGRPPGVPKKGNKTVKVTAAKQQGSVKYKQALFIKIVGDNLPVSTLDWTEVAKSYMKHSGEAELREVNHMKRYWKAKCCNNFHVPTGSTEGPVLVAQRIQNKILEKENCGDYGVEEEFDETYVAAAEEESDEEESEEEAAAGDALTELATQAWQMEPAPVPAPAVERRVPHQDNKSKNVRNNPRTSQATTISTVAKSLEKSAENSTVMQVVQMMMQQQQQQQQQQNNQMMTMMMFMFRDRQPTSAAENSSSSSSSSSGTAPFPAFASDFHV